MGKNAKIDFRVSEYEKRLLISKAKKAGMKMSDFCRKAAFDKKIIHIEGLPQYLYDLNKIGTNINQIAVAANQGRDASTTLPAMEARLCRSLDLIDQVIGGDSDSDSQTD
jgi:hypothetical protein